MGKEIIVIDPAELEKQIVQEPAEGDTVIDLSKGNELPGQDPDEMIATTRNPFGSKGK